MSSRYIWMILFFCFAFASCDPGISVAISNKTKVDKNIQVFYPSNFKLPLNSKEIIIDSLYTYDLKIGDNWEHPIKVPLLDLDTTARKYSFILSSEHEAIVESHWPASYPTYGQIFIIDNSDTIKLVKKGKDFKKNFKFVLGGQWKHTILDQ